MERVELDGPIALQEVQVVINALGEVKQVEGMESLQKFQAGLGKGYYFPDL